MKRRGGRGYLGGVRGPKDTVMPGHPGRSDSRWLLPPRTKVPKKGGELRELSEVKRRCPSGVPGTVPRPRGSREETAALALHRPPISCYASSWPEPVGSWREARAVLQGLPAARWKSSGKLWEVCRHTLVCFLLDAEALRRPRQANCRSQPGICDPGDW